MFVSRLSGGRLFPVDEFFLEFAGSDFALSHRRLFCKVDIII